MRLTRRGWAVVVVVVGSIAMGWQYGPRALNAVVTPLLVVLVAGTITTALADRPRVRRGAVAEGFVGETRTIAVTIETERAVSATVRDAVDDGLTATTDPAEMTTLDGETEFSYDLRLEGRGDRRVGPLAISVVDLFGLVERRFEYEETASVLVYPPVYDLRGGTDRDLHLLADAATRRDREEFDHLREYQRGDSLRDVHWKSAAKRPDDGLVVTEYVNDDDAGSAVVAAECTPTRVDDLATAVASVATYLLEEGVNVGVTLPAADRQPGSGHDHHYDLLGLLAVVEAGELDERARTNADVLVQADANGTRIVVDDRTIPFDRLRGRGGRDGNRDERTRTGTTDRGGADDGPSSGVTA
ncbi:DUF58 domain-containing protein [Halosolutus halophilus]|uniref:DUF58 domain-containing protein n=1 Tax=Halosolutus halophilus TaxID=1552990 RepID=UPI00223501F8|nr:DUF58 domain-containing protein [Halosolutus halophilus]